MIYTVSIARGDCTRMEFQNVIQFYDTHIQQYVIIMNREKSFHCTDKCVM